MPKTNEQNHIPFTTMGRPKGRNYIPFMISLTPEQVDWLKTQPNASKLIRDFLTDLMEIGIEKTPAKKILGLKAAVAILEDKLQKTITEYQDFEHKHETEIFECDRQERIEKRGNISWPIISYVPKKTPNEPPIHSGIHFYSERYIIRSDAPRHLVQYLKSYEAAIEDLATKIAETYKQIESIDIYL